MATLHNATSHFYELYLHERNFTILLLLAELSSRVNLYEDLYEDVSSKGTSYAIQVCNINMYLKANVSWNSLV